MTKISKNRKTMYALIAGVLAISIGVISAPTVTAEPGNYATSVTASAIPYTFEPIVGSVDVGKDILGKAKIDFSQASKTAESSVENSSVIRGNLGIQNDYLVYSFSLVDNEKNLYTIVIDAGNGEILHTSDGHPIELQHMLMGMNFPNMPDYRIVHAGFSGTLGESISLQMNEDSNFTVEKSE